MTFRPQLPDTSNDEIGLLPETSRIEAYRALGGMALEESVTGFAVRYGRRVQDDFFGTGAEDLLSADEANRLFGLDEGLSFDEPISEYRAREMRDIKVREQARGLILSRSNVGMGESFAVSIVASLFTDPLGDALALVPYYGQTLKGGSAFRASTRAGAYSRGAFEGVASGALVEGVIAPLALSEGRDYGIEDTLINLTLSGGIGSVSRRIGDNDNIRAADREASAVPVIPPAVARASDETRQAAFKSAVAQVANDQPVNVTPILDVGLSARADEQLGTAGAQVKNIPVRQEVNFTPKNEPVPVTYAIVELDSLTPSHDDNFKARPDYPDVLQPRSRGAGVSAVQVQKIYSNFNPAFMDPQPLLDRGPPLIAADGIVESGNGRALVLRKLRNEDPERFRAYTQHLAEQGYNTDGFENPVLVRIADPGRTPQERVAQARSNNKDDKAEFSSPDEARIDAEAISDQLLLNMSDDVTTQSANILRAIADETDLPRLVDGKGRLSQDALLRLNRAMTMKAFDDELIISDAFQTADSEARAINTALVDAAPEWARLRAMAANGDIDAAMDITPALTDAVATIRHYRQRRKAGEKLTLQDVIAESDASLIRPERAAEEWQAFSLFYDLDSNRAHSTDMVKDRLSRYIEAAMTTKGGPDIFGGTLAKDSTTDILARLTGSAGRAPAPSRRNNAGQNQSGNRPETRPQQNVQSEVDGSARADAAGESPADPDDLTFTLFPDAPRGEPDALSELVDDMALIRQDFEDMAEAGIIDAEALARLDVDLSVDNPDLKDLRRGLVAAAKCIIGSEGA